MKVIIVTIIDNQNIGTFLQAYALATVIKKYGHEVKILNYRRKHTELWPFIKQIWMKKKSNPISAFFSILYRVVTINISRRKLHYFLIQHIAVSKKYNAIELYHGAEQEADVYIVGSDQVWNSRYNKGIDEIFYLDFVRNEAVKLAYAASLGNDGFNDDEKDRVRELLQDFRGLSVREFQSVNAIHSIGISNVVHVLDPTMLISVNEWTKIAQQDNFIKTEPFLLVYSVEITNRDLIEKIAKKIAQKRGLKVYVVTTDWFRGRISCDRIFYLATPERFLSLFYNADFVIASSFHGTVFSLNFEKEFLSVSPQKYNARIRSLLELVGLKERIVFDSLPDENVLKDIDYETVNKHLELLRKDSYIFLNKELEIR